MVALAFAGACTGVTGSGPENGSDAGGRDAGMAADAGGCKPASVLYLNRSGGTYKPGDEDDSSTNTSMIVDVSRQIPAYPHDEEHWGNVVSCIRAGLQPFNIDVVEEDPGDATHMEVVFTTSFWGQENVSALSPAFCDPSPRAIAFVFGSAFAAGAAHEECEVAIQAFAVGVTTLDHAFRCEDYLSWLTGCGDKSWVDESVPCGELEARECQCGGATQNSFQTMLSRFGATCD
jgi:hypothetical protein